MATYLVADPADPASIEQFAAEQVAIDTWSATDLFQPAPVLFDLPADNVEQRLWDFDQKALTGSFIQFEHPNGQPVSPDSILNVTVNLEPAFNGEALQMFSVGGAWPVRNLEPPAGGIGTVSYAVPPFTMATMSNQTGRAAEQITVDDAVFVLRYVGGQLSGVGAIAPFDQTGNDTLVASVAPVAADIPLDVRIDPAAATTRYLAARPAVPNLGFSWVVRAVPGHAHATIAGINLNSAAPLATDLMIQAMYANPFAARDWRSVLSWNTSASRVVTPAGQMLTITLFAAMSQLALEPPAGTILDLPAGLPELISLDGRSLSTDNETVTAPVAPVEVTFITDRDVATLYELELFEILPNADATALVTRRVIAAAGLEPRFVLPQELFEAGKTYFIRAHTSVGGFTNVASGDLRTREYPVASAFLDSGVFQVTP
jgi:hypothetical protein